ncbi:uncharacterized protein CLUP02_06122 [Colletotrichum lupini]|uniref:Uncharacterized protein n=1 Tax=Colletotrichum lupini TaxID=145971 RepID=A0A9Q8SNI1_9PEZI|nr:uncharacterized protein CLUP02_06122 [Colletotrichum lupini]UQC80639.1 hypothetical protein CLUP02_06122 [Colletotrichum lupini]
MTSAANSDISAATGFCSCPEFIQMLMLGCDPFRNLRGTQGFHEYIEEASVPLRLLCTPSSSSSRETCNKGDGTGTPSRSLQKGVQADAHFSLMRRLTIRGRNSLDMSNSLISRQVKSHQPRGISTFFTRMQVRTPAKCGDSMTGILRGRDTARNYNRMKR